MEQIKFSDLFDEGGISGGLKNMVSQIESVKAELLNMLKEVKEASASISSSLSSTSSVSKGGRDDTRVQAGNVEQLYSAYQELTKAITECNKNLANLSSAQAKAVSSARSAISAQKEQAQGQMSLAQAYSTLSGLIQQTGVSVEQLLQSQRQLNIAQKNGEVAAKSATGSYNQLYAQYNLIKNVLNAMSTEMRNAEGVGKLWEAEALRIMNAMKGMQEATGKHTLSVGDYSKAFNGLSIATQQVLREMPTLANSMQQFFIAISNNVPIFVDNLMAVQRATGSWVTAMKGVLSSVLSWQTALLVVLTILPKIAKAISDKRKAVEEDNESISKNYDLLKLDAEATRNAYQEVVRHTTQLKVLYGISQDVNRSWGDRIDAAKKLKVEFKDELANFTAEEIALGKAKTAIDELLPSLVAQAEAKAYLNEISNLTIKAYDLEKQARKAKADVDTAATNVEIANANRIAGMAHIIGESVFAYDQRQSTLLGKVNDAEEELQKATKKYEDLGKAQKNVADEIKELTDRIDPKALLEKYTQNTKENLGKITDYYWEWAESNAKIIKDEQERELALNDVKYEKAKDAYQKILDEATTTYQEILDKKKAGAVLTDEEKTYITEYAEQEKYLTDIILNLETERQQARLAIIDKYYQKLWAEISKGLDTSVIEEQIDEEDVSISGKYDKMLANISKQIINARESLNDSLVNGSYKEAKQEGSVLNDLLAQKLNKEAEYQKELLLMRLETADKANRITKDQYDIELASIDENLAKALNKLKGKQRRKVDIWDLLFGSKQTDEYGNVFKKLDEDSKAFIQQLISGLETAMQYLDEFMDKRIEMAEIAVEAAQKESEAAKTNLDYEMEARANGYANNVDLARREYEEKLAIEQKAIAEKQRLEKVQEGIDTLSQISSLVTSTAMIWQSAMGFGLPAGPILAAAVTALLWGSFAAAKVQAAQLANAKTYGEGGMEYIDYGGSHASGRDVDFGRTKDGRPRRVEKGEVVSVINKKNVEKYGVSNIENIINSLNNGTFEKKYISSKIVDKGEVASVINKKNVEKYGVSNIENIINSLNNRTFEKQYISSRFASTLSKSPNVVESTERNTLGDMYSLAFSMLGMPSGDSADLSTIERGISTLVSQNDVRVVPTPYGRIEYKGNNTRIIRNS